MILLWFVPLLSLPLSARFTDSFTPNVRLPSHLQLKVQFELPQSPLSLVNLSTGSTYLVDFDHTDSSPQSTPRNLLKACRTDAAGGILLDLTAGVGQDSGLLYFSRLWGTIISVERDETIAALLKDGVRRLLLQDDEKDDEKEELEGHSKNTTRWDVVNCDGVQFLEDYRSEHGGNQNQQHLGVGGGGGGSQLHVSCIYIDCMFNSSKKSKSSAKLGMQMIRDILVDSSGVHSSNGDENTQRLLKASLEFASRQPSPCKVVLKRGKNSPTVLSPTYVVGASGRVRFDCYQR